MARPQHILALCVAALLLAADSSAADADAAAAAAQAAATPVVPQTSTNVASADPDSSVRVSQQTAREKANGRTGTNGLKPAAAPSPAPAVPKADAGMNPAVPVSGKAPPSFPGAVGTVTTPVTAQQTAPASGSITATFPGTNTAPVQRASPSATTGGVKSTTVPSAVPVPATAAATPEPAAAAPAGAEEKKEAKKEEKKMKKAEEAKKEKAAGTAEGATEADTPRAATDTADGAGGSATVAPAAKVPQNVRSTALDAKVKPETATGATPAVAKAEAVPATLPAAVATPATAAKPIGASAVAKSVTIPASVPAAVPAAPVTGASATAKPIATASLAKPEAVPASVPAASATGASASAQPVGASAMAKAVPAPASVPAPAVTGASASAKQVSASATAAAIPASAADAKPATPAAEQQVKAAAPQAAAKKEKHMKASTAPGAAEAAKMSAATAGRRRSLLEPEGTLYDGQGNVVQNGIPATAPIPSRAATATPTLNPRKGQVATTDVSDRSAIALDRAAIVAAKMAPAHAPAAAAAIAPGPRGASEVANEFYATNPGTVTSFQSTGGSGGLAGAAQTFLSGLANNLNGASQQAASTQGTGVAAQPYASAGQSAPATYSAIPQQASANAAGANTGSAYAANTNTASANTGSANAAGASNGNNGVLSGTTYQSSGATSPLTPYNTAMDNSIGNMGKQLGALVMSRGQQSSSLQQTPTVDAANSFQQPQLPANRDIVHLSIPLPSEGNSLGRRLLDTTGEQQMGQTSQNMEGGQSYGATTTTPAAATGNILQSTVGRLQDAAYSLHNKLQGAEISSMPMAATVAQPGQAAAAPAAAAGTQAGVAQALTPQWTIDPSLQQPSGASDSAASQQSASSGSSAQPMSASVTTPSVLAPAADIAQDANVVSAQPMAASEASAAPVHVAGTNPAGALQMPGATNQVPLPSSMQTGTAANAVADGMQRAVANAQNIRNARAARSANPQAISATAMAASEQSTAAAPAAPSVDDALAMGATVPQQQQAQPAVASSASMAAPQQQVAQPNQHQASSSKKGLTQIGSSGTEPMGAEVSAAQPMSASSGSLVDSNGGVLINAGRPTSEEQALGGTTGFVAGVMAGRKLQQTNAPKADGSLVSMVHDAVNDPSTQAAFAHVMEAAATETKALTQLSGPATAPAPGSITTMNALSNLVSSVSHNALAAALPGQPPSNQQQFNDWEKSLQSPAAKQAKQAAAKQDAGAVQGFNAAAAGKALAQQVDQAASTVLLGAGRRRLAQEQAQPSLDLDPYIKSLQQVGSGFQEAGQAAGNAVGLTPARLHAVGAQLQEGTQAALIGAAKHVVRSIGVDSNTPGYGTPSSEYGYNPISSVVPYSASTTTAPAANTGSIQSASMAAPQATGTQQMSSAASADTAEGASAAQQPSPAADASTAGRRLRADDAQAQAQAQAQTSEQTANTVKALIAGVSSLASAVKTALAPAEAAPAAPVPAVQQMGAQTQVPQTQAMAATTTTQPQVSQQGMNANANLQSQYGGNGASAGQGGHVGVTEATTFAGENGNQLSANDIHLDNTPSSFVIGPDGKVPSLASQGGAAAVAQQQGLLVPNGAAAAQSVSPSPGSYGTGYGAGAGSASSGYGQGSAAGTPANGYGANSPPSSGYGASSPPTYGSSSSGSTPSYGTSATPAYGSGNAASTTPPTGASSVPGTVTAYNQGQAYGSSQQSNASGGSVQSNSSGPSVQGTSFANAVPTQQNQPQQGTTQQAAYQQAGAPMQG